MKVLNLKTIRAACVVAAGLFTLSCSDSVSPNGMLKPAGASRSIGSTSVFSWLAPLGTGSANPTTLDANAATSVSICAWTGAACSGSPVAQFALVPSSGVGQLTVNRTAGEYEASVNLLSASFLLRKTYRISVLNGTTEIGSFLFDAVHGRWAPTRTDGTVATLLAANTLPIVFHVALPPLPPVVINEVESNGGTPDDWVEFYNQSTTTVDLSGYKFKDNDDTHAFYVFPAGTTIAGHGYLIINTGTDFSFGLGAPDAARFYSPDERLIDSYSWTAHAATTYGRCPDGTGSLTTTTNSTKGTVNDCSVNVKINEVESNGGTPGDWVELINNGTTTVDLSGFKFKDNDDTHAFYVIPAGKTIPPGGYLVLEEAQFIFGLGTADAARLFYPDGVTLVDSYSWTAHATTTYGRCPNGTGAFVDTKAATKGALNSCGGVTPTTPEPWPGGDLVGTADGDNVFGQNLSGLIFEAGVPDVLWAVRNGPSTIFRLVLSGGIWTPDALNEWGVGKTLLYTSGTGAPDSEDLTFTTGSSSGMYVATERDNGNGGVSRPAILRYDVTTAGASLIATNDWNLSSEFPGIPANSGIEALSWIPDSFLTSKNFFDDHAGHIYNPADYPSHGGGLFFLGLEADGVIYVYALNHSTNAFTRITSIRTGFPAGVMALRFDAELGQLWATCDDTCHGLSDIFVINGGGKLQLTHIFSRPPSMPDTNNEGFAIQPQSKCVLDAKSGLLMKPVFWSDDANLGNHAIRQASVPCAPFSIP